MKLTDFASSATMRLIFLALSEKSHTDILDDPLIFPLKLHSHQPQLYSALV